MKNFQAHKPIAINSVMNKGNITTLYVSLIHVIGINFNMWPAYVAVLLTT
jgi:hypothetical protein